MLSKLMSLIPGLPSDGTDIAVQWNYLYGFLIAISLFFFVLVVGTMLYFAFKYRAGKGHRTKYITDNHALEIFWTLVPTILLLGIFAWGWVVYRSMVESPPNAYEVRVIGKQWLWQFQYDDGRMTVGELFVPVNRPVKLLMTSEDVIHSFFVPNFRVKQDVVPGMYTSVWFEAKVPGEHQVFCTEYCGAAHSGMLAKVIALKEDQWDQWTRGKLQWKSSSSTPVQASAASESATGSGTSLVEQGRTLSQTKGCIACHSTDGSKMIGPSYKGVFGREEELTDGTKITVDENYIRESIEDPQAKVVKGFTPVMPTFKGMLTEAEINALVAYVKSVK